MKIKINNKVIPLQEVSYNDGLNFGRINQPNKLYYNFSLELNFNEFLELIEDDFNQLRAEIKEDDSLYNDSSSFKEVNYNDLKNLLYAKSGLENIIVDYLDRIIYDKLFTTIERKKYTIQSTHFVEINNDKIIIVGQCF